MGPTTLPTGMFSRTTLLQIVLTLAHSAQTPEPDYETILSALEGRIKQREAHLLSIRLRERRANALFITYGLGAWLVYLAIWWFVLAGKQHGVEKAVGGLPVVAGPVM